ncbi:M15 family metallopeptidase [Amycolatopsis kentuckyensis]|uniref:M15 family metallopeptidase n=1 Tax=Amycolatopsis kentuckyensis TaxID=218823 RepID=UPI000A3775B3|nr:M15 family metallopeptidase [Amycolatopsis kentuckyensis]
MPPEDVLPSDPRLSRIPVRDSGEALVDVRTSAPLRAAGPTYLRYGLVDRLVTAQSLLPRDVRLLIVDGYRPPASAIAEALAAAEHPTGGAVDLTLSEVDEVGRPLPACGSGPVPPPDERTGALLASALVAAGLVNYPARWWHWSYGDRFWAWVNRAPQARYGPVPSRP